MSCNECNECSECNVMNVMNVVNVLNVMNVVNVLYEGGVIGSFVLDRYDELDEEITTMKTEVQNFKAGIAKLPSGSCRTLMFVKVFEDTFQSVAKSWQTWNLSLLVWLFD